MCFHKVFNKVETNAEATFTLPIFQLGKPLKQSMAFFFWYTRSRVSYAQFNFFIRLFQLEKNGSAIRCKLECIGKKVEQGNFNFFPVNEDEDIFCFTLHSVPYVPGTGLLNKTKKYIPAKRIYI